MQWTFNYFLYFLLTGFSGFTYHLKTILNKVISTLLGFILAAGIIGGTSDPERSYIMLTLIIIIVLVAENYICSISKHFDMSNTLISPINVGVGMRKLMHYSKRNHLILLGGILLIELIKIGAGIYDILVLDLLLDTPNTTYILQYSLLGLLLLESVLGLIMYSVLFILVLAKKHFFEHWLQYKAKWYLHNTVDVRIYHEKNLLYLEMHDLTESELSRRTHEVHEAPHVVSDLVKIWNGDSTTPPSSQSGSVPPASSSGQPVPLPPAAPSTGDSESGTDDDTHVVHVQAEVSTPVPLNSSIDTTFPPKMLSSSQ